LVEYGSKVLLALVEHGKEATSFRRLINIDSFQKNKAGKNFWMIMAKCVSQKK